MAISVRGGDIEQLIIDGREFSVQGGAGVIVRTAKYMTETIVTGNGKSFVKRTRVSPGFNDCPIVIDELRGDNQFLSDILDRGEKVPTIIEGPQGVSYSGDLDLIVGDDFGKNMNEGIATISMAGDSLDPI